jgi:hypothetical protein
MGLEITAKSLGYLKDMPEELVNSWHITEYRAGGHSTVTIAGDSLEEHAKEVESRFYAYYHPNGYGSEFGVKRNSKGNTVLVLSRWLSCD